MSVFRIKKNRDYTVMSNYHLRDMSISLKAKGLLSMMLSLPEDWNYTIRGLAKICKEGVNCIGSTLKELENTGYMQRRYIRDKAGRITDTEYTIFEQPKPAEPCEEEPHTENRDMAESNTETGGEINIDIQNKDKSNTDFINYPSINTSDEENQVTADTADKTDSTKERWIDRYNRTISEIKEQIDYDSLINTNDREMVDEVVNIMADVMTVYRPKYKIEGEMVEHDAVIHNFKQVTADKLDICLINYSQILKKVNNTKAYWITVLYNIPMTSHLALSNMVNHNMYMEMLKDTVEDLASGLVKMSEQKKGHKKTEPER